MRSFADRDWPNPDFSGIVGAIFQREMQMNNPHFSHRPKDRWPSKDHLVMGVHAIREILRHAPDRILKIYCSISHLAIDRKHELLRECEARKIPISNVTETQLEQMTGSDSHQSFAAHIQGRDLRDLKEFLQKAESEERVFVLMLDQIFDPQNFGALLRSAECFGVDAVIWSKNRGCDITPVVAKASCGASELLPLIKISNLADAVDKFKKAGFEITATIADPKAEPLSSFEYAPKTVLILGSEGEGIQPLLIKKADRFVYIPLQGKIESLNVAQAAAIFLFRQAVQK